MISERINGGCGISMPVKADELLLLGYLYESRAQKSLKHDRD